MRELLVSGLSKSFGTTELFHDVSFRVARGERAGLVGANGAGKTTLMRCLLGEEEPDGGTVRLESSETIGYVEQQASLGTGTLHEEFLGAFSDVLRLGEKKQAMEKAIGHGGADEERLAEYGRVVERFEQMEGYDVESRIRRVAFGLGFSDADLAGGIAHLSGGQKTRVCLAKALLREPDFLFLDEPTNHLDIRMIEWLEEFLRGYRGGVLLISHDRFFLDRVATKIIGLEHRTATVYAGNYSYYQKVRDERRAALESAYEKQQEKIRETEEYIRRYRASIKAKQARGYLGAFLFRGDEVERVIGDLSGGEQSRLAFLKLMLTGANFLVLDEPTNHLDIPAKEAVEEALMAFPGTFVVVSHDRYFLNRVANVTLELAQGRLTRYDGGYDYYKEKKAEREAAEAPEPIKKEPEKPAAPKRKETAAGSEKSVSVPGVSEEKRQELLLRAEAELAMAEAELKMLEREMNDSALQADPEESRRIAGEYAAKQAEIERRYEKWGALL